MVLASLLHVANDRLSDVVHRNRDVYAYLVDLVPARSTRLLDRVCDVVKSLVDFLRYIFRSFPGRTIPTAYSSQRGYRM
jgi:hypothetical protein